MYSSLQSFGVSKEEMARVLLLIISRCCVVNSACDPLQASEGRFARRRFVCRDMNACATQRHLFEVDLTAKRLSFVSVIEVVPCTLFCSATDTLEVNRQLGIESNALRIVLCVQMTRIDHCGLYSAVPPRTPPLL